MMTPQPPNLLLICADQLAQRAVGVYGDPNARTPNIDALARTGARFANSYTPCPLCLPARAACWTGRLPHQTGVTSNGRLLEVPSIPVSVPTLGSIFAGAGYNCVHFGKTHDAGALRGFCHVPSEPIREPPLPAHLGANDDTFLDRDTTRKSVAFLRTAPREPFLMVADLNNPHNICGYVGANRGPHVDGPMPGPLPDLPPNFEIGDLERRPLPIRYICCSHNRLAQAARWSRENYRHYLAAYYFYLERVDGQIGELLAALDAAGLRRNTLVVFYADHGDGLASHRMTTKQVSFYEEVARIPLIAAGPGVSGGGRVIETPLVSLMDLLPTLCACAGLTPPRDLWGMNLQPWLAGDDPAPPRTYVAGEWYSEWGFTISPGRMIRSRRYKYTCYVEDGGEELYDLETDPGETHNHAHEPDYAGELAAHRQLLREHIEATADPFFRLKAHVDPRWRSHPVGYRHHEGPAAPEAG